MIDEEFETNPINHYGHSKLMSEQIIKDEAKVNSDFKYIIFRYFNVAGADIYIDDLSDTHIKATDYLWNNKSDIFNCGYGHGYSVKQIMQSIKDVIKVEFKVVEAQRREANPAILVSNNTKIKQKMNWIPKYDDLNLIIKSASQWEFNL